MSFYYDAALRGRAADGFNGLRGPARQLLDALHEKRPDEAVSARTRAPAKALLTDGSSRLALSSSSATARVDCYLKEYEYSESSGGKTS